jgi:hypothetical protein
VLDEQISALYGERTALESAVFEAEQAVQHRRAEIDGVEGRLRKLRQVREQNMREENQRAVRLAEVQTRATDLLENIQADFGLSLRRPPSRLRTLSTKRLRALKSRTCAFASGASARSTNWRSIPTSKNASALSFLAVSRKTWSGRKRRSSIPSARSILRPPSSSIRPLSRSASTFSTCLQPSSTRATRRIWP